MAEKETASLESEAQQESVEKEVMEVEKRVSEVLRNLFSANETDQLFTGKKKFREMLEELNALPNIENKVIEVEIVKNGKTEMAPMTLAQIQQRYNELYES